MCGGACGVPRHVTVLCCFKSRRVASRRGMAFRVGGTSNASAAPLAWRARSRSISRHVVSQAAVRCPAQSLARPSATAAVAANAVGAAAAMPSEMNRLVQHAALHSGASRAIPAWRWLEAVGLEQAA